MLELISQPWPWCVAGPLLGLTGACPGPIFALIGNGVSVMRFVLLSSLAGTWVVGRLRDRLSH